MNSASECRIEQRVLNDVRQLVEQHRQRLPAEHDPPVRRQRSSESDLDEVRRDDARASLEDLLPAWRDLQLARLSCPSLAPNAALERRREGPGEVVAQRDLSDRRLVQPRWDFGDRQRHPNAQARRWREGVWLDVVDGEQETVELVLSFDLTVGPVPEAVDVEQPTPQPTNRKRAVGPGLLGVGARALRWRSSPSSRASTLLHNNAD